MHNFWQHTEVTRNSYVNKNKQIFCGLIYNSAIIQVSSIVGWQVNDEL